MITVNEHKTSSYDCYAAKTAHKDIVALAGCLPLPVSQYQGVDALVFDIYAMMLDKGTASMSKMVIAEKCEAIGASIQFSAHKRYLTWQLSCLRVDLQEMLSLVAALLSEAVFPQKEWMLLKKQMMTHLTEELGDPETQAETKLSQSMYDSKHPSCDISTADQIDFIKAFDLSVCQQVHQHMVGQKICCVSVGDLTLEQLVPLCDDAWSGRVDAAVRECVFEAMPEERGIIDLDMADKPSITCLWGKAIPYDITHPDYWSLKLGVDVLGGGCFSSRLMSTVREKSGLTYRIASYLKDFELGLHGCWVTYASFGYDQVRQGIEETQEQQRLWFEKGVTEKEISLRKQSILNRQALGWSKTKVVAASVLHGLMNGYGKDYLTVFPDKIKSVNTEEVNRAIRRWASIDELFQVRAGSLPKELV